MSNPQLSILWGERLMGGGESVQGKLITSTRKIKIKKKIVIIKKKSFSNTDISNFSSQATVSQTLNFKNIQNSVTNIMPLLLFKQQQQQKNLKEFSSNSLKAFHNNLLKIL